MSKTIYVKRKNFPNFKRIGYKVSTAFLLLIFSFGADAQDSKSSGNGSLMFVKSQAETPVKSSLILTPVPDSVPVQRMYKINPWVDITLAALGTAGTLYGFAKIGKKSKPDSAEVVNLPSKVNTINRIDRGTAGNFSEKADDASDIFFYAGYPFPIVLLFDKKIRKDFVSVYLLYIETMGLVGSGYSNTAGHINKFRPYTWGTNAPLDKRWNKNAQNSFYGGHPSAVAGATFFAAKVFGDYNPDSKLKYVFYTVAAGSTFATAYLRMRGGNHFPTDLAIGCTIGTTLGILVPHLHKQKKDGKGMSVLPFSGQYHGLAMTYKW